MFGKVNRVVEVPRVIDLTRFLSNSGSKFSEDNTYRLYGMVVHLDLCRSTFFGHYIIYILDDKGVWHCVDDHKISEVSWQHVQAQHPYLLLYARRRIRPPEPTEWPKQEVA